MVSRWEASNRIRTDWSIPQIHANATSDLLSFAINDLTKPREVQPEEHVDCSEHGAEWSAGTSVADQRLGIELAKRGRVSEKFYRSNGDERASRTVKRFLDVACGAAAKKLGFDGEALKFMRATGLARPRSPAPEPCGKVSGIGAAGCSCGRHRAAHMHEAR